MPPGINLMAVSDALKSISSTAKLIPGAGDTVAGALDLASEICKMVQDVKSNKKNVEKLAVRASGTLAAITDIIQRADETKQLEYEKMVKELCSVYQEMKNTTEKLTKQNRVCQFINRSQIKETLTDLDGKLSKASSDFQVQTSLINTMTGDIVKDLCTAICERQINMERAAEERDRDAKERDAKSARLQAKTIELAVLQLLNPVATAAWNSYEVDKKTPCCLAGTRIDILKDIYRWASSAIDSSSPSVLWLCGPAGTGKSTIAHTVCKHLSESMTCTSFFFSRQSPDRRDPSRVACSLAFHLAEASEDTLRATICSAIEANKTIASRSIPDQIKVLLEDPLSQSAPLSPPLVFVLDALDECDKLDHKEGGLLLPLLLACIKRLPASCSVRLLVTSREQPSIQAMFDGFRRPGDTPITLVRLHEIENSIVQCDIARYLQSRLREIRLRLPKIVPSDWPDQADLDALAARAGVLFVYAATLVRYIDSEHYDPRDLLCSILDGTVADSAAAYTEVDQLYSQILDKAVESQMNAQHALCRRLRDVVGSLILLRKPLSAAPLARLLGAKLGEVNLLLSQLSAVLVIYETSPVTVFHNSFPDFITDPGRCHGSNERFYVDSSSRHATLARQCLVLMNARLTRDICNIKNPSLFNSEVTDLPERLRRDVPDELAYACRYWVDHIDRSPAESTSSHSELLTFCRTKLLAWVEVLSLMGILHLSYSMLDLAKQYCNKSHNQNLTDAAALLDDLNYMIREFYPAINDSALHVYYSAVPMTSQCPLLDLYSHESHSAVRLLSERQHGWNRELLHTFPTGSADDGLHNVPDLIFLNDSRHLLYSLTDTRVSRSWTMEIWDVTTGKSVCTSEKLQPGRYDQRVAVSLSPDQTRLVSTHSGSHARIWSTATAQVLLELREHNIVPLQKKTGYACNAFSSDGLHVAVSLDARSVQIWDAYTGNLEASLPEDHRDSQYIKHLVWSSDCRSLICVLAYRLCIWDIKTALVIAEIQPIRRAHLRVLISPTLTQCIGALAYQEDIDRNGYVRLTYKLWAINGVLEREVLIDCNFHETEVDSLLFSADGKMILINQDRYYSSEPSLSLWDLNTGTLIRILHDPERYNHWTCINISDDGSRVAAGSAYDKIYRIYVWNTQTGMIVSHLMENGHVVTAVSISPDFSRLASFSTGKLLRLWDVSDPHLSHTIPRERETLNWISVCDDGNVIVSVSGYHYMLTVWDTQTCKPIVPMKEPRGTGRRRLSPLSVSADGSRIIGGCLYHYDMKFSPGELFVCVWDSATGRCVGRLAMLSDETASVSLSKDGSVAAVVGRDDLCVWNVRDDRVVSRIPPPDGEGGRRYLMGQRGAVMSPDGSHVATYPKYSGMSDPIQVYDVVSCQIVASMSPPFHKQLHTEYYARVKYLRDGTLYAFQVDISLMESALHAWNKDTNYGAITTQLPIMYVFDPREGSRWIWRVVNGDIATSHRVCWIPPDRYSNMNRRYVMDNNSPGNIMAFLSVGGHLTVLDFADVACLLSSL